MPVQTPTAPAADTTANGQVDENKTNDENKDKKPAKKAEPRGYTVFKRYKSIDQLMDTLETLKAEGKNDVDALIRIEGAKALTPKEALKQTAQFNELSGKYNVAADSAFWESPEVTVGTERVVKGL
jgi:hypothetical protein